MCHWGRRGLGAAPKGLGAHLVPNSPSLPASPGTSTLLSILPHPLQHLGLAASLTALHQGRLEGKKKDVSPHSLPALPALGGRINP